MRQSVQPHSIRVNLAELTHMDEDERHGRAACDVGDADGTEMRGRDNVGLGGDVSPCRRQRSTIAWWTTEDGTLAINAGTQGVRHLRSWLCLGAIH